MAIFNPSGWTPTAEQVSDLSQAIVQEIFQNQEIGEIHDIQQGISHDKQILLYESFAVVGEAISSCVPAEVGDLTMTEKTWTPKLIGGRKTYCVTDESQNLHFLKQAKNTLHDYFERNPQTSEFAVVFSALAMAIYDSILPKVWFSDTAAALTTGGGVFKVGTNLGLFNQIDGLFKQIFALGATYKYTITKNTAVSYALQALASGEGLTIVKELYNGAGITLTSNPNGVILVTNSIYKQLMIDLADKGLNTAGVIQTFMDGIPTISVYGVPVKVVTAWDVSINKYQNDGTVWNLPHRAVYTTKTNIPIGTLSTTDMENLEYVYDKVNKKNILDFAYFLDAKVLTGDLVYAAY